jgi:hypothetical protein
MSKLFSHHIFCGVVLQLSSPSVALDVVFPKDQYKCIQIAPSVVAISIDAHPSDTVLWNSPMFEETEYQRGHVLDSDLKTIFNWFRLPHPIEGEEDPRAKLKTLLSSHSNNDFKLFVENMEPQYYLLTQRHVLSGAPEHNQLDVFMPVLASPVTVSSSFIFPVEERKKNHVTIHFAPKGSGLT